MKEPGHLLKLRRARAHLDELKRVSADWLRGDVNRHWIEAERNGPFDSVLKVKAGTVPADPFALLVGDVVQNLRNSLDHLAFELAQFSTQPMTDVVAQKSQFPIVGDVDRKGTGGRGPALFKERASRCLFVDPRAAAVIERLQPFRLGRDFTSDPLWVLAELSNIDKHRMVHVVVAFSGGFQFKVIDPSDWPFSEYRAFSGPVRGEAVVARFVGRHSIDKMEMQLSPDLFLSLNQPFDNIDACKLLGGIHSYILTNVVAPLEPFLTPVR